MALDPERYLVGDDGLLVEKVDSKSSATTSTSLELQGAIIAKTDRPGPVTGEYIDSSPVTAFKHGEHSAERFATIEISDREPELLAAARTRLQKLGAPIRTTTGPAVLGTVEASWCDLPEEEEKLFPS